MAEKIFAAVVQEAVSKGISFLLGKHEEKAFQSHIMEKLEMAVSDLELALERSAKLPITDVSLLWRRKMIKRAYVEGMELLDKNKLKEVPAGQGFVEQRVKRKRLTISALNKDDVRRFEWFADCAGKFVRDVESGCSLRQYTFCNPGIRHLLEGKTLRYELQQGHQLRRFYIWPTFSEERGVEAVLGYRYVDNTMAERCFFLLLVLRLSESIDIVPIAIKGLQFLTSQFKLAAESAMGELTLLPISLQDTAHSYVPPCVGIQEWHTKHAQHCRPDPACSKAGRHGLFGNNNALSHIFPEQVVYLAFQCYVSALEPRCCTSSDKADRSINRGWTSPLAVTTVATSPLAVATVAFEPHSVNEALLDSYAVQTIRNAKEGRDASIQVPKMIKSDAIRCILCLPELTEKPNKETRSFSGPSIGQDSETS